MWEMEETWVWLLGPEDPLEEGMATRSSILAWRIPWTEEPGRLQSIGSQRVKHDWVSEHACTHLGWECAGHPLLQSPNLSPAWELLPSRCAGRMRLFHSPSLGDCCFSCEPWWAAHIFFFFYFFATYHHSVQFSSVAQLCLTLCNPLDCSTTDFPVHHQFPEPIQTHVYRVSDAIQWSHSLLYTSPSTFNLSQHQSLFKWVSSLHQVYKAVVLTHGCCC